MEEVGTEQGLGVDSGWLEVRKSGKRWRCGGQPDRLAGDLGTSVSRYVDGPWDPRGPVIHALGPKETILYLTHGFLGGFGCEFCSSCLCVCSLCRRQGSRLLSSSAGRSSAPGTESAGAWRSRS